MKLASTRAAGDIGIPDQAWTAANTWRFCVGPARSVQVVQKIGGHAENLGQIRAHQCPNLGEAGPIKPRVIYAGTMGCMSLESPSMVLN